MTDRIPAPPEPANWRPGQFMMSVDVEERAIAFTFDDGPSPYNTYSVLRTLADHDIKATFFLIGVNVRSWPDIARDIVSEGHELGNHSVYHRPYQASPLASQIGPNQNIIRSETGVTAVASRAPGLTRGQSILDACAYHGLYECHTHMATNDWRSPRMSASALYSEFVRNHRNGAFALYHDGGNSRPTPAALPSIIGYAKSVGYRFTTATGLTGLGTPQPVSQRYPQRATVESGDDTFVDRCRYDAEAVLKARLDDPGIKRAERSRIVEVLAEYDDFRDG